MAINKITDTSIEPVCYYGRAVQPNLGSDKRFVRQSDGTLWSLVVAGNGYLHIVKSVDDGFSWTTVKRAASGATDFRGEDGLNVDGAIMFLAINERFDRFDIYIANRNGANDFDINRDRYLLSDIEGTAATSTAAVLDIFQGVFQVAYNLDEAYLTFVDNDAGNDISVRRASPRSASISGATALVLTPVFNTHATVVDKDNNLHVILVHQTGGENIVKYAPYLVSTGWGTVRTIENFGNDTTDAHEIDVALDGYGNLCAVWSKTTAASVDIQYATSVDSGVNWDVNTLSRTSGHGEYTDAITSDYTARTRVIGGQDGGFLISYIEDDASTVPKGYIRELTTSDSGATYDLQAEQQIATGEADAAVISYSTFFYPTDVKLMDFRDPGLVRMAYQRGEGDSATGQDETPVDIEQEKLDASAYPSSLASESGSYSEDQGSTSTLKVELSLVGGPGTNEDFYAAGFTGTHTTRFLAGLDKLGTFHRLLQYEPDADNTMNDRTAYDAPIEHNIRLYMDPQTYSFPIPDLSDSDTTDFIERDVRKIYVVPTHHLSRTFVVNSGGFLKRTVWTLEHDGNEYEISQVVPRFIDNQICYYEANAYVIGPSRNPFSRTVLPSET